jgi:hypothetical protein
MERLSKVGRDEVLSWLRIFSYYVLGITGGSGGDEYIIPPEARKQGYHQFVIESSCNGMFGVPWNGHTIAPPDVNPVL